MKEAAYSLDEDTSSKEACILLRIGMGHTVSSPAITNPLRNTSPGGVTIEQTSAIVHATLSQTELSVQLLVHYGHKQNRVCYM